MNKLRVAIIGIEHCHIHAMYHGFCNKADIIGIASVRDMPKDEYDFYIQNNIPEGKDIKIWDDYKELLNQNIDIVIVCTSIKDHADIVCEALAMDKHVIIEKPFAFDMHDAKRMYEAYKKSKGELIINWPVAWFAGFNKAKELADSGAVGQVHKVHYRSPSTRGAYPLGKFSDEELSKLWWYKKDLGGGSIFDYAGYGCALTTWIANKCAKKVYGLKKNYFLPFSDTEDYSVFTIDFGDCVGLIEGSWSTMSNGQIPTGPIVYGSDGVIVADRFTNDVRVYKTFKPYVPTPDAEEVYELENSKMNLADNVINFITKGEPLHELLTADFNMKAQAALDAGKRSCESGIEEKTETWF